MRSPRFLPLLLALLAPGAAAVPPSLVWTSGCAPASAERIVLLVVSLDDAGATLVSSRAAPGPLKLRPRAPEPGGAFFVVRDATGAPLLIGETFDASRELHGDDADPATGAMMSLSVRRDEVTFLLKVPPCDGARDVVLAEWTGAETPSAADVVKAAREGGAGLTILGRFPLP